MRLQKLFSSSISLRAESFLKRFVIEHFGRDFKRIFLVKQELSCSFHLRSIPEIRWDFKYNNKTRMYKATFTVTFQDFCSPNRNACNFAMSKLSLYLSVFRASLTRKIEINLYCPVHRIVRGISERVFQNHCRMVNC